MKRKIEDSVIAVIAKVQKLAAQTSAKQEAKEIDRTAARNESPPSVFAEEVSLCNVLSASGGAKVLFATDEWFAAADNLVKDNPPVFDPDAYCEQGKVMDGWESRRRREAGHDWCLITLSQRAHMVGIEIDTAHFTGNHVPEISLELADIDPTKATALVKALPGCQERLLLGGRQGVGSTPQEVERAQEACEAIEWQELLKKTPLNAGYEPSRMHRFVVSSKVCGNYLRINYFPDGGVARLRLWGIPTSPLERPAKPLYLPITTGSICTVVPHASTDKPPSRQSYEFIELSGSKNGGEGIACSNRHYGEPWQLIQDTLGKDMGDGWETARHPDRPNILVNDPATGLVDSPLNDWAVLKLGKKATNGIARVLLDTKHFRGNYPESVLVEACCAATEKVSDDEVIREGDWFTLVSRTRMAPDSEHVFDREKQQLENDTLPVTHVRVCIFPDGGLSRVRVYG